LVSRISRRVLAEHHIALSDSAGRKSREEKRRRKVTLVSSILDLNVEKSVRRCTALLRQLTHDSDNSQPSDTRDIFDGQR